MLNTPDIQWKAREIEVVRLVRREGFVSIDGLARTFGLTPQTLRRDVKALCERGLLRRHHGGVSTPSSVENAAYARRRVLHPAEKRRIAALVVRHIPNGASLFINIGTTTEEVARALHAHEGLKIVTNNLNVAAILSANESCEVIVCPGVVRARDRGITGAATVDFVARFKVDFGIVGISGIDEDGALLDFDFHEVCVAQAMMKNARRVWLATDHSKFGRDALVRAGHLSELDALYTDREPPAGAARILAESGVSAHIAMQSG